MAEPTRGPAYGDTSSNDDYLRAMAFCQEGWTAETINFQEGRDDQRFYANPGNAGQWDPIALLERQEANRPAMTFNRLPGFVHQVTNDIRKDTPAIKVVPSKDGASEEVAEVFNGMIRSIQDKSNAKAAYVQAVENACVTGLGAFMIKRGYASEDGFEQELTFHRFVDPFQVIWDPACRMPDKSDARYVFVFHMMPKEVFAKKYPKASMSSMPSGPVDWTGLIWYSVDSVRIAEYWYKKPTKKKLLLLSDGSVIDAKTALEMTKEGQVLDVKEKREIETNEICMRLMSGKEFLTDESVEPGKYIPIVPVVGEEIYVEGRCVRRGMVREAKDAQRAYNYLRTIAVEASALQPKVPWILTKDMIRGLENHWGEMGRKNLPYAIYNPDKNAPGAKPERAQPALVQAGLDSQAQLAGQDLQAVIGIYNVSLGAPSEETSGRAILARQKQGDTGTYNYVDNLGTAVRYAGQILVDLIPKIYDTPRIVRTLGEDGSVDMAPVNHPVGPDGQPLNINQLPPELVEMLGAIKKMNDLTVGEYDVTVITGPSFATKRMEAAETLSELATKNTKVMEIGGDIILKNMDFPGAEEVAKRWERTLPPNVTSDQPLPPPPPPPDLVAKVEKDQAQGALYRAQAENQEILNVGGAAQMFGILQQMQGQLMGFKRALDALSAPPGSQPPQAQPMPAQNGAALPVIPSSQGAAPGPAPNTPSQGPVPPTPADAQGSMGEFEPMPEPDPLLVAIKQQGQATASSIQAILKLGSDIKEGMSEMAKAHMADTEMTTSSGKKVTARRVARP